MWELELVGWLLLHVIRKAHGSALTIEELIDRNDDRIVFAYVKFSPFPDVSNEAKDIKKNHLASKN
jgi:hypothetical protein